MPEIQPAGALHSFYFYLNTSGNIVGEDSFYTSNPDGEAITGYTMIRPNWFYLFMGYTPGWGGVPYGEALAYIGRYWNPTIGDHLFKQGIGQGNAPSGYIYEGAPIGVGYVHNGPHRIPVYRYWNPTTGDHRFKTKLSTPYHPTSTWYYEGIAWYSPIFVYGCRDSSATNWNMYANQPSTGCTYNVYGCTDPLANNYNSSATHDNGTCTYTPATASISVSPSAILAGGTSTLSWYTNYASLATISGIGSVSANQSGSQPVSPSSTTSYTLTAYNYGNVPTTASTTLNVYQPPVITLSSDAPNNTITQGQSFTLTWNTSGDNSGDAQLSPILGSVPASSNEPNVSPTVTTTYTISVNGYLGTNDSDEITITVIQPPESNVSSDPFVLYGENINVEYSTVNAVQVSMIVTYYYVDGTQNVTNEVLTEHSDSLVITPPYNTVGPSQVSIRIDVEGYNSLTATAQSTTAIIIDQQPTFSVPESRDKMKDEDPVITPDSTVTTDTIEIDDIDIPVEIKSNHPIQVDVDDQGWLDVKEI